MTVEENLEMGAFIRTESINDSIAQVYDLFPILKEKGNSLLVNFQAANASKLPWVEH